MGCATKKILCAAMSHLAPLGKPLQFGLHPCCGAGADAKCAVSGEGTGIAQPTMMNNFTPRAQQVLALARKEADRFNHNYVGTEHLLLGLIKLGQGVAVNVLQKMGLDLETVRMEVEKQVGSGPDQKMVGNIPYTPRVKKVLALAGKEAKALNHSYVGTEHILLGLLREGEGVAARVLKNLEVDIERTRNEILKELDPNFAPPEGEQEPQQEAPSGGSGKKDGKTPALRAFGRDLTELAKKGRDGSSGRPRTRDRARHSDPLPPHQEQPSAHR
jgi:ATP-dependent Clp protease ATP-binding subunit ClpA